MIDKWKSERRKRLGWPQGMICSHLSYQSNCMISNIELFSSIFYVKDHCDQLYNELTAILYPWKSRVFEDESDKKISLNSKYENSRHV